MMNVLFNNESVKVGVTCTLSELLQTRGISEGCFSIAINQQFIRRADYALTKLAPHDRIDLIQPMQGG